MRGTESVSLGEGVTVEQLHRRLSGPVTDWRVDARPLVQAACRHLERLQRESGTNGDLHTDVHLTGQPLGKQDIERIAGCEIDRTDDYRPKP